MNKPYALPRVATLAMNVKGADLLFLDHPDQEELDDQDRKMWETARVNIDAPPFKRVIVYTPLAEDGVNRHSLRNNPQADVPGYSETREFALGMQDIWPYLDFFFDKRSDTMTNLLAEVAEHFFFIIATPYPRAIRYAARMVHLLTSKQIEVVIIDGNHETSSWLHTGSPTTYLKELDAHVINDNQYHVIRDRKWRFARLQQAGPLAVHVLLYRAILDENFTGYCQTRMASCWFGGEEKRYEDKRDNPRCSWCSVMPNKPRKLEV